MVSEQAIFLLLANAILILHLLFVLYVILGLGAIGLGYCLRWQWVRNRTFRISHLLAIAIVVVQAWLGAICPLTRWEMALRDKADVETYAGSFIQHWLHSLLYYNAPDWVFTLLYTAFGAVVLASWFIVRPVK